MLYGDRGKNESPLFTATVVLRQAPHHDLEPYLSFFIAINITAPKIARIKNTIQIIFIVAPKSAHQKYVSRSLVCSKYS